MSMASPPRVNVPDGVTYGFVRSFAHGVGKQHVGQWVNPSGPSRYGRNVHAIPSRVRSVLGLRPSLADCPAWHCRISTN